MARREGLGAAHRLLALLLALCFRSIEAQRWSASCDAAQQVPPISDASLAAARANFSMWTTQQPDGQVAWALEVTGIQGLTMAHIHFGAAGQANGKAVVVLLPLGGVDAADGTHPSLSPPINGSYRVESTFGPGNFSGPLLGASLDTFLAAATGQQLYVALHTTQYPAGALRGQLAPAAAWVAEVVAGNNIPPLTDQQVHGGRARFAMAAAGPTIQGTKYTWTLAVESMVGMSMAHFHAGGPTENGPHVVMLVPFGLVGPNASLPLLSPTFSGSQTFAGDFTTGDLTGVTGEAFDSALRTDPTSAFYVSIHTEEWSAGALRGQVLPAFVWEADLAAANNVPPLTDLQVAGARASFTMVDLGTSYSYQLTVQGVQDFTNAHLHWGGAAENGPIIINLVPVGQNLSSGSLPTLDPPFSGTATYRGSFTTDELDGVAPADFKAALRTGPSAQLYVAVHTAEWPGGAIRGQLHWAASPGDDVLSMYNDLSGNGDSGGGGTSGAARHGGGTLRALTLALALAAVLALLL